MDSCQRSAVTSSGSVACIAIGFFAVMPILLSGGQTTADEVTAARVVALPAGDREAWEAYLARSREWAASMEAELAAEVSAAGLPQAIRAPDGGDFRPPEDADRGWFASDEGVGLIASVLSFQSPAGGWSKHLGYGDGPRRAGMQWTSQSAPGKRPHYLATIDNGATTRELRFLADAWQATQRDDCREAVARGVDFLLAAQYPNGGWPQVFPLEGSYHDGITLNDDAMTNVLATLQAVADGDGGFSCVDEARRERARAALDRGLACVLEMQLVVDGVKTAWCAQYDALTLEATAGRAYEPASLGSVESSRLLKFLMTRPEPSPDLVESVERGLAWLERSKLQGLKRVREEKRTVYVADPASEEIYWARFYDLESRAAIFPGKDGLIYDSFEALAAANDSLGYDYLSTLPGSVIGAGQKKWRAAMQKRIR